MRCALAHIGWLGAAAVCLAFAPGDGPTIVSNQLAASSPSGVSIFLACAAEATEGDGSVRLCWGGERGLFSRSFRLTTLKATDAGGAALPIHARLGDANLAAWRDAASDVALIGGTPAYSVPLVFESANGAATAATLQGSLELKLGKSVIRVAPESRTKNQPARSSLLDAKGLKLTEIGEQQRLNLQFTYSNEKKGTLPNLFLVDNSGKAFYSSKPRVDGMGMVRIQPTEVIPPDARIRVGTATDKGNLIPEGAKLLQSKELLAATLAKRGLRIGEYACRATTVFVVEVTRAPAVNVVPEVVLDFSGRKIKGQSTAVGNQQDPNQAMTASWTFDLPAELAGTRPDVLVLVPGDEGVRSIPFEFRGPFAASAAAAAP
jgi:hypothetical protein